MLRSEIISKWPFRDNIGIYTEPITDINKKGKNSRGAEEIKTIPYFSLSQKSSRTERPIVKKFTRCSENLTRCNDAVALARTGVNWNRDARQREIPTSGRTRVFTEEICRIGR